MGGCVIKVIRVSSVCFYLAGAHKVLVNFSQKTVFLKTMFWTITEYILRCFAA